MNINSAFPSKYLRAADLGQATPTVTIAKVTSETVGEDQRLVVYFVGKDKGLVLNKTNANAIADILGDEDTDNWPEGRIKLVTAKVDFQGKRVLAIRIDEPAPVPVTKRPAPPVREPGDELDAEDIGF
jgi:hypothetical protein